MSSSIKTPKPGILRCIMLYSSSQSDTHWPVFIVSGIQPPGWFRHTENLSFPTQCTQMHVRMSGSNITGIFTIMFSQILQFYTFWTFLMQSSWCLKSITTRKKCFVFKLSKGFFFALFCFSLFCFYAVSYSPVGLKFKLTTRSKLHLKVLGILLPLLKC